jgi:RNA polymerase sigma-70 factor (ECF subfamily)
MARAMAAGVPAELAASQLCISLDDFRGGTARLLRRSRVPGPEQFLAVLHQAHDAWLKEVTVPLGCYLRANPAGAAELPNEHRFAEVCAYVTSDEKRAAGKKSRRVRLSAAEKYALRLTDGEKQMARDAVEAAFDRAVLRLHTFRGKGELRAWFFRIVRHEVSRRMALCVRKRQRGVEEINFSDEVARRTALRNRTTPGQESSDELVDRSTLDPLTGLVVEETVRSLPPKQREVYERVLRDGMHPHEVADLLNISRGKVRARLHAARKKIREALGWPREKARASRTSRATGRRRGQGS